MARIITRKATIKDIDELMVVEKEAWEGKFQFKKEHILSQIETYPEGVIVADNKERIEGFVVIERVDESNLLEKNHSWLEISDNGYIVNSHVPDGNVIYGVNLSVARFASKDTAIILMEEIAKMAIKRNIKHVYLGSRVPRYYKRKNSMSIEEYIAAKNPRGGALDPEINMYQKAGMKIVKTIPNYFEDPDSLNYGILMVWKNPFYNNPFRRPLVWFFKL